MQKISVRIVKLVLLALFTAILLLLAFTPLGLIDLPIIKATILHVPVIIGSVLLGPVFGGILGGFFGAISLFKNTVAPSLLSFAFSPLVPLPGETHGSPWAAFICFVPRILTGVVPYFVALGIQKLCGNKPLGNILAYALAGFSGAAVNTALVMGSMGLVLGDAFAAAQGIAREAVNGAIMGIVLANGVPEAIAAVALVTPICLGISRALKTLPESMWPRSNKKAIKEGNTK